MPDHQHPDLFDSIDQISPQETLKYDPPEPLPEPADVGADAGVADQREKSASQPPIKRKRVARTKVRTNLSDECFLSVKEVANRYSLSVPTIWRYLATNPSFPKPHRLEGGPTRWRLGDLRAYEGSKGGSE